MELPPYKYIDTPLEWERCAARLAAEDALAVDLEANSLFAYRERICLIQISTRKHDYIIDPLADLDLAPFGALLEDPHIEKVFHASDYDMTLLKREFDWEVENLFDTMWAARIMGYKNMGLAWFLDEWYGVKASKKWQKADWSRRPLPDEQLRYAQVDTAYLLQLREDLAAELAVQGRLQEAREIFANLSRVKASQREFDPEGFWSVRGAQHLRPRELAVLRELYIVREEEAERRDLPPFKVLNNSAMLRLAEETPDEVEEMRSLKGVPNRLNGRFAQKLLVAINKGCKAKPPKRRARSQRPDPAVLDRFDRLMQWRKTQAQERGVESDVILTRETMWEIAHLDPRDLQDLEEVDSLGPHRLSIHGRDILKTLKASVQ